MSGDEPFVRHGGSVVLLLLLVGFLTTPWLTLRGARALIRARAAMTRKTALVAASTLAWAATVGMYTWGLLHVFIADDYSEARACDAAVGQQLVGYDPSYVPLEFNCLAADGRTVPVIIPSYVNPILAVLVLCAVALTIFAIVRSKEKKTP